LQPLASHIASLINQHTPETSDITLTTGLESFKLHKFVLSARSPYFQRKFSSVAETTTWKLPSTIPAEAFYIAIRYLYLGDVPADLGIGPKNFITEEEVFKGIDKVSKHLEIESLWEGILSGSDRRIARQRHQDEVTRGRDQLETWYRNNVLKHKITIDASSANEIKWSRDNGIFADIMVRANEDDFTSDDDTILSASLNEVKIGDEGIPVGPKDDSEAKPRPTKPRKAVLFPAHRAMLIRSDYFLTMFSSQFHENQVTEYLQIITVDCSPAVLEVILNFLYTEKADIPLELAIDVLFAADMLFIEKLKTKAATVISTLGNGSGGALIDRTHTTFDEEEVEAINIYDVLRAGWITRMQRLEEFAARYLAYRLEDYIDEEEFEEIIKESASRIQKRQETDSIELLDE
jgi:hypothetical protein